MNVMYDISPLADGYRTSFRTGIFRVVESLALQLAASQDCHLELTSSKYLRHAVEYLRSEFPLPAINTMRLDLRQKVNMRVDSIHYSKTQGEAVTGISQRCWRKAIALAGRYCDSPAGLVNPDVLQQSQIYHSTFYEFPEQVVKAKHLRRFLTVYDIIPIIHPEYFQNDPDHMLRTVLAGVQPEDYILAISEATQNDVCNYLKIDPARVFVTPLAADPRKFYRTTDAEHMRKIRAKYDIPNAPYVLTLGTLEPRKNMDHVVRCFIRLVQEGSIANTNLVLTGIKGWDYTRIFDTISQAGDIKDRILWTGRVADEDLAALYSGALAFTYMSHYEGFGLPPLEAMQCGTPVITSNTSSLPEVVGAAGITLAPTDADGLCQAIINIHLDEMLRAELSHKSLEHAKQFSWEKCGKDTIRAYKTALTSS